MPLILLILAVLTGVAGVVLWVVAARLEKSQRADAPAAPAEQSVAVVEPEPPSSPEPSVVPEGRKSLFPPRPGHLRRARRDWAHAQGYDYHKSDEYLVDEFTRGAAATGAIPKDIVAGRVFGHEMLLMDIGPLAVMAMRTGAASEVIVDFRRAGAFEQQESEDLVEVAEVAGFAMYSSEAAVAERMVDVRLITALETLPEDVTAVWLESEWALAQFPKESTPELWADVQPALALIADVARVLPPRSSAAQVLLSTEGDPTRVMEQEATMLAHGPVLVAPPEDDFDNPPIQRPEEPVELPTRTVSAARGNVSHRALGADEVDAIADGKERPQVDGPRIRRNLDGNSSIFDDEN